ncbi:hypothetical protein RhiJN_16350 [Ceratobasidium sp. AG-Ba]|nr:hypothetical protein RhiJN_16350 [Ceratobasidium sp. AG-Ba]
MATEKDLRLLEKYIAIYDPPFHGYFLSNKMLQQHANSQGYPFANKERSHLLMAKEIYYKLEALGILRLEYALCNGRWGYILIVGKPGDRDGTTISPDLRARMDQVFKYPPKLLTYDYKSGRYLTPSGTGSGMVALRKAGKLLASKLARDAEKMEDNELGEEFY